MKNDNLAENNHKYNNIHFGDNDNEYVVEISKIANELYSSSKSKKNYNFLINNLNHEIMGDCISDEENDIIPIEPSYSEIISARVQNDHSSKNYKQSNNMSTNNSRVKIQSNLTSPRINNIKVNKYTDVNANSKFYNPESYDTISDLDYSQWSDRSNRIKYYGRIKESNLDETIIKQHPKFDYKKY
jgi:hypothetical protein